MTDQAADTGLQLFSTATDDNRLELSLRRVPVPRPGAEEVVVRVEATPLNPSDLGLLLSAADPASFKVTVSGDQPVTTGTIPAALARVVAARKGKPMPVGNEAAGTVVKAGESAEAQALLGKTVAIAGGAMYTQNRLLRARDCLVLPEGATAEEGASSFVNPMTALAMVSVLRRAGEKALVHTAAASNLGQMLVKLCRAEGIPLVNIVRSEEQVALLRSLGATHVCNSASGEFMRELIAAITETGAFLAFDAIGGGPLAGQILTAMEAAAVARTPGFSVYGSTQHKQVYLYGRLDSSPTQLTGGFGFAWGVGGWLLTPYLQRLGAEEVATMRRRVAENLRTIFASHYTRRITLQEALQPENIIAYSKRATGEKYLITPAAS